MRMYNELQEELRRHYLISKFQVIKESQSFSSSFYQQWLWGNDLLYTWVCLWMQKDGDSKSKSSNIIVHNYHDFFVRIISYFGKICPIKHGSHDTTWNHSFALQWLPIWISFMEVDDGCGSGQNAFLASGGPCAWSSTLRKKKINFKYLK